MSAPRRVAEADHEVAVVHHDLALTDQQGQLGGVDVADVGDDRLGRAGPGEPGLACGRDGREDGGGAGDGHPRAGGTEETAPGGVMHEDWPFDSNGTDGTCWRLP